MITINNKAKEGMLEFKIQGKIDQEGMENFSNSLHDQVKKGKKIKILGEFNEVPGFESLKAFGTTMKMKVVAIKALSKYAILTKKRWVKNAVRLADKMMPKVPMRVFGPDQRSEALAWLGV